MLPHTHILVADDDVEMLNSVAEALERVGADVVRAHSGAELIERIADRGPFALIVTDVAMPFMSGLHGMHSARSVGHTTPVIVMTGLKDERLADQVRALGPNVRFLQKPFELADLETAASSLLSSSGDG